MSDEFDKDDDLSWLRDDDKEPEDDEKFDWQKESDAAKSKKGEKSLGFTGELPWLQDDESAPDAGNRPGHLGMTGELPWMQDSETGGPGGEKSGLTGELPWMQGDGQATADEDDLSWLSGGDELVTYDEVEAEAISDEEALDWISADDADFVAAAKPAPEPELDLPEWLKDTDTSELISQEPAARTPEPEIDDAPDWLKTTVPRPVPDPIMDVPDWLMDADDEIPEENKFAPGGKLSAEWLAQGEGLPETSDSELTFDQWVVKQAAAERVPDLDEQLPDLSELTDEVVPADMVTGELPDWFLGMEEIDTSNAPTWFTGEEPAPTPTAASEIEDLLPDWLSEEADVNIQETAATLDDDFLSNLGLGDKPQTPAAMPNFNTGQLRSMFGDDTDEQQSEAAAALDDEFFSKLGADEELPTPTFNTGELQAMFGEDTDEALPEAGEDDFFSKLGVADQAPLAEMTTGELSAMLGDDFDIGLLDSFENQDKTASDEQSVDDYIASLSGGETSEEAVDWFGTVEEPEQAAEMDWLDQLSDVSEQPAEPANMESDFGIALASAIESPEPSELDNILASLETSGAELPSTGELLSQDFDFDTLLSDPAFSDIQTPRAQVQPESDILPGDNLDFLNELGASVSANSAAAIVRQRKDRPLDELPDRLKKLHDRGDEAIKPPPKGNTGPLSELLPGVSGTLVPSVIEVDSPGIAGTVTITPEQRSKIDLLKSLAAADEDMPRSARTSAIDRTYDTPFLSDEDDFPDLELTPTEKQAEEAAPAIAAPRRRTRVKIDRIIISLLVAVGVILPFFVGATRIGNLPPSQFIAGSREQAVFDAMNALEQGQFVLVGVEYGPTAASELDTTTAVLLRHILAQGARPVIVSGNPVALLRANNIIDSLNQPASPLLLEIGRSTPLQANEDYFVTRYLAGNLVGLRTLGGNMALMLALDFRGQATDLNVSSLSDFAAVVVIAERAEDLRAWAEQISPLTSAPVLAAVGFAAEPLSEPYLAAGIDGLLVGYRDAFTYDKMLASGFIPPAQPAIELTPTTTPGIEATTEVTTEATQEALEATPEITVSPTDGITTQIGTIRSDDNVNLREGPGTSFATISTILPGDLVEVLGSSEDGEWTNIRLTNGVEGWVSADFVRVSGAPEATSAPTEIAPTEVSPTEILPTETPVPTNTPGPTNTSVPPTATRIEPTNTPFVTNTPAPTNTPITTPTTIPTIITARVIADTRINVRSGPGTTFQPVSAVDPGTEFVVIGRNGDGSWIQVQLEDGREGWVSASLVEVSAAEAPTPTKESSELIVVMADGDFGISGLMPRALQQEETREATSEATVEVTPEITEEPEATAVVPLETAQSIPYGEQRWYSMTLGLAVIIVVIMLGALVNIVRGLLRRK
jgi:uncharacterized protein YgiM (DUF1202 family)